MLSGHSIHVLMRMNEWFLCPGTYLHERKHFRMVGKYPGYRKHLRSIGNISISTELMFLMICSFFNYVIHIEFGEAQSKYGSLICQAQQKKTILGLPMSSVLQCGHGECDHPLMTFYPSIMSDI